MKEPPSSTKRPPALDEGSFQKLLEAAFVLQEHNQRQRGNDSQPDLNASLSAIVETHKLIQTGRLDFRTAVSLVAEQAQRMTHASAVAVGIVEAGQLAYRAATGTVSGETATLVPIESSVSFECLRDGKLVQYGDAAAASSPGVRAGASRGIRSLVAAPIYHKGRVAGAFELRFSKPNSFQSKDVGTAQLMAGLVSEAMLVADVTESKPPVSPEHKALLDALERLGPDLKPAAGESIPRPRATKVVPAATSAESAPVSPPEEVLREGYATTCVGCGNPMEEGEAFCGSCGTARPGLSSGSSTQSKFASLWRMQQAAEKNRNQSSLAAPPSAQPTVGSSVVSSSSSVPAAELPSGSIPSRELEIRIPPVQSPAPLSGIPPDALSHTQAWPGSQANPVSDKQEVEDADSHPFSAGESTPSPVSASTSILGEVEPETAVGQVEAGALAPLRIVPDELVDSAATEKSAWTSARKTREWLDALKNPRRPWVTLASQWWRWHRANVYVALATLIFSISVVMLVVSPNPARPGQDLAASGAHRHKAPPPPEMTFFEKFLVSLGLAEPPDAPAYMGDPNAKVWVDLHTALYYCPGAELYGKTAGGKFTTQRDAQQDQFQPASRKVCE